MMVCIVDAGDVACSPCHKSGTCRAAIGWIVDRAGFPAQLRRSWLVLTVLMCYFVVRFMRVANSESVAPHKLRGLLPKCRMLFGMGGGSGDIRYGSEILRELFHDIRVRHPKVNPSID
jgi:hypothetical protein